MLQKVRGRFVDLDQGRKPARGKQWVVVTRRPQGAEPMMPMGASAAQLPAIIQSGALSILEADAKRLILRHMSPLSIPAGRPAFRAGDTATNYLLVKAGGLRVSLTTEEGREIVLYRVQPGETCVLTTAALMSGQSYDVDAVAEADTEAIILPKPAFEELIAVSPRFRQFVFSSFGERLHTLLGLVQEITFRHMDRKLARLLLQLQDNGVVSCVHQSLATELKTAREVVTRLLHDFADRGWVELARGRITLRDQRALKSYSHTL